MGAGAERRYTILDGMALTAAVGAGALDPGSGSAASTDDLRSVIFNRSAPSRATGDAIQLVSVDRLQAAERRRGPLRVSRGMIAFSAWDRAEH